MNKTHILTASMIKKGLAAGIIASMLAVILWTIPGMDYFLKRIDLSCLDSWTRMASHEKDTDIILVAIDENSIEQIGPWPWDRSKYAKMINFLARAGAKIIAVDLLLDRPNPTDNYLADAMNHAPTALAVYTPDKGGRNVSGYGLVVDEIKVPSPPLFQAAAGLGHVVLIYDQDGVIRRIPSFISDTNTTYPAFGITLASLWHGSKTQDMIISPGHLYIGSIDIPLDSDGFFYIGYTGGPGTFPRVSASDVLRGDVPSEVFKDKLAIIGMTSTGLSDMWTTPFAATGGMTGLELMANSVQAILDNNIPQRLPFSSIIVAIILIGVLGGITGQYLTIKSIPILLIVFPVLLWFAGAVGLMAFQKIISFPPMATAWMISLLGTLAMRSIRYRGEMRKQAEHLKKLSKMTSSIQPKNLCSILQEITDAEMVIGLFKNRDEDYCPIILGDIDEKSKSELDGIVRQHKDKITRVVSRWVRMSNLRWYVIPIESGDNQLGLYIIKSHKASGSEKDKMEQAKDFAAYSALLLEHERLLEQLQEHCKGTLEIVMSTLEKKAPGLMHHSNQVAELAKAIALHMKLDGKQAELIYKAGMLHDLGLVGVPDHIITKKSGLTPEERVWVESHPGIGAEMVAQVPQLKPCAPIIRQHHERYDGKGYPDGLAGEEILLEARILAVAEAFVSIMTKKFDADPHKDLKHLKSETIAEVRRCGDSQFDMDVVQALLEMENDIECR